MGDLGCLDLESGSPSQDQVISLEGLLGSVSDMCASQDKGLRDSDGLHGLRA